MALLRPTAQTSCAPPPAAVESSLVSPATTVATIAAVAAVATKTTDAKASVTLPDEEQLSEMITGLLDRRVTVRRDFVATPLPAAGEVALFDDDDGDLAALAVADIGFAAATAAALTLIPVEQVTGAVDEGTLGDSLRDNYYEVVNILSSLLNGNPARHVRLTTTHPLGEPAGVDVDALVAARAPRTFRIEVDGYGSGTFQLIEA